MAIKVRELIARLQAAPQDDFVLISEDGVNSAAVVGAVLPSFCRVDPNHPHNPKTFSGIYRNGLPAMRGKKNVTLITQ